MTELVRTIALACPPARAFDVFTRLTDLWWPRGHRKSPDSTMLLEPPDGRLVERAPDGSDFVMGRITAFEPPRRLAFDWFPGSPAAPTAVDITFTPAATGTEIRIQHRALSSAAAAVWPDRVALFARGWDTVLPALQAFIASHPLET